MLPALEGLQLWWVGEGGVTTSIKHVRGEMGGRGAYNEAFQSAELGEGSCQTVYGLFVVIPSHDGVCMCVCRLNLYMQQQADLYIYIQSGY